MRILGVTPYYLPEGGGLERYAHEGFQRLAARGHEVHVVSFTKRERSVDLLDGVTVDRHVPWRIVSNTPVSPGFYGTLTTLIEEYEPDVVSAHGPVPFPLEMAALACRRTGVPLVMTYHAGRLDGGSPLLDAIAAVDRATLEAHAFRQASRIIAVSEFVKHNAAQRHPEKVAVIPPGVDHTRFTPAAVDVASRDVLFVGSVSRSYAWKGFETLYRAFRRVAAEVPDATLSVVGTGDLVGHYAALAARDGLAERVRFLGRLPEPELVEAYRHTAVACLPSTSPAESFGMVLAEANACGKPVVASRIGGIPEVVAEGATGLLVTPGDADALAEALAWTLTNPEAARRMGTEGRARILANHDWDRIVERTESVLLDAVGRFSLKTLTPGRTAGGVGVSNR